MRLTKVQKRRIKKLLRRTLRNFIEDVKFFLALLPVAFFPLGMFLWWLQFGY